MQGRESFREYAQGFGDPVNRYGLNTSARFWKCPRLAYGALSLRVARGYTDSSDRALYICANGVLWCKATVFVTAWRSPRTAAVCRPHDRAVRAAQDHRVFRLGCREANSFWV